MTIVAAHFIAVRLLSSVMPVIAPKLDLFMDARTTGLRIGTLEVTGERPLPMQALLLHGKLVHHFGLN